MTVNAIVFIVIHGHGVTLLGIIAMQSIRCGLLLPVFCGPCVLVTTVGPTKTDELIAMPYWGMDLVGTMELSIRLGVNHTIGTGNFGRLLPAHYKE